MEYFGNFDISSKILCDICHKEYNDENLPKILMCSHTFCNSCIEVKIRSSLPCPECSTTISDGNTLTNHLVLTLAKQSNKKIVKRLKELEDIKKEIVCEKEFLDQQKDEKMKILDTTLNEIENLFQKPKDINDETLEKIKHEIKSVKKYLGYFPKFFIEFSDDSESFLLQIYKKVSSGEKLLTAHRMVASDFGTDLKYGKISVYDNIVFFHCLENLKPEDGSEFIRFDVLKTTVASMKFRIFMIICPDGKTNRIITIRTLNSVLFSQFIRLCTGECNDSYIGKIYGDKYECSRFDYAYKTTEKIAPVNGKCFVFGNCLGNFWFSSSKDDKGDNNDSESTLIGVVERPSNLIDFIKDDNKILDCGIAFYL